ncbi:MAG: alpha-galactosidase [Myxococcota bacterium]
MADDLGAGERVVGPVRFTVQRVEHGDATTLHWTVCNRSAAAIQIESACMEMHWLGAPSGNLRFLRHGWQSWSMTEMRDLDDRGEPAFPSGEWLRGLHHAVGAPPADRLSWHESDTVTVVGLSPTGPACLVGVLERGISFGNIYLRPGSDGVAIAVELRLEVPLEPGESRQLDSVRLALGGEAGRLLESFAELWGRAAGARTEAPFQAGWCSWYHFFHDVSEDDMLRNLDALAGARAELPIDVVQLDDGYQRAIGDWLITNDKFPRGLAPLASDIRAAGFRPGIWTAPLCATAESWLVRDHREWLLRDGDGLYNAFAHSVWSGGGWVHALDTTQPAVIDHLRDLFGSLVEMGFTYLKLDFLFAVTSRSDASDPRVTRAERLRRGLEAVRAGAGDDAFLLGCGCPLGPAVGVVDGMRIGPDVAPTWEVDDPHIQPGLEPAAPATHGALRSIVHRAWMHRRLWLNDPDCLMARTSETQLTGDEVRSLAASIAVTGGMVVISDDWPALSGDDKERIAAVLAEARAVDAMGSRGVARAHGWLDPSGVCGISASGCRQTMAAAVNLSDQPTTVTLSADGATGLPHAADAAIEPLLATRPLDRTATASGRPGLTVALKPHESALVRLRDARQLAVFCDFDGTFAVDDIGATLGRRRIGSRGKELFARYQRGEVTAWQLTFEILDGMDLPRAELDEYLAGITIDPGARGLMAWCNQRDIPFRILSDGFDYNLERIQELHGVSFEFDCNQLRYEGDTWRISPGHPDPACICTTGTCKRSHIQAWRAEHPAAFCVHIGNGRISDLCGALTADLTFAKDSLADALSERGAAHELFDSLRDVTARLDQLHSTG